ncbi:transposase IS200 like family protein [Mycobacterium xenopi 3993]|nr:transposase IS200 like family protein [Mycobacterium xenopi 3993]EUA17345.1 transposase IS200 like family protein [Mycobacterium xenopi 3993]
MLTFAETTMRTVCAELDVELVEFNGEADHVHLLVAYPPTLAISALAQRLKGRTAYAVRREFTGACVRARMRGHLWSPSYFAVSCGGARCRSSSNTSTAKPDLFDRRATPGDIRDGLTPP